MATQFMFSPQLGQPMHGHMQQPQSGNAFHNGGFAFRKRFERVDWRKMASVDIEHISRTLDFNALQENIMNITFCNIETELDVRTIDPNFLKLFKLAQLTIEYLLYSQEYLAGLCTSLEDKASKTNEDGTQKELEALKKELADVKRESHKRKKLLIAQQQLMHAGAGSYNRCPFCPKAFLNSSFLQAHISRRHASGAASAVTSGVGSGEPSKAISPDHGVGDSLANNPQYDSELNQIKERLRATEAQLEDERNALASLRRKEDQIMPMVANKVEAATEQQSQVHRQEMEEVKEVFMRELREVNEKYMASERALAEMEQRYGVKRSYLGSSLQDDVDNEKEMLQQQRAEVAALQEELQKQMDKVEDRVHDTMRAQERRRQHRKDKDRRSRGKQHRPAVEDEVIAMDIRQEAESPVRTKSAETEAKERGISMYPSDEDEESFALASGTSSLRTPRTQRTPQPTSTLGSTLGLTGTGSLNLRTSQFLEQLRQNPTLGIMRDQLGELLAEKVEKCGIPRGAPGIDDTVLHNKLSMQRTQRQAYLQKYPNFMELRERYNKEAHDRAVTMLRQKMKQSPRSLMADPSPRPQTGKSPRLPPSQHEARSASMEGRSGAGQSRGSAHNTPRSSSAPSPRPRAQVTPRSQPHPQPRAASPQKTPLSTGSTTEWTSTQWDSEDDSEEDDISGVNPFSPSPNVRLIQSGPRPSASPRPSPSPRHQPRSTLIQSRPLRSTDDDDIDDILGSDGEDDERARTQPVRTRSPSSRLSSSAPQPRGGKVAGLARDIQKQLGNRGGGKPVGGVDTMSSAGSKKNQAFLEDFDEASDWDDTEPSRPPPRGGERRVAGSTDLSSNTYGTSQWGGSTSKGASTVKPDAKRSTSRSSFVSVTDLSSDEDMNVDNI